MSLLFKIKHNSITFRYRNPNLSLCLDETLVQRLTLNREVKGLRVGKAQHIADFLCPKQELHVAGKQCSQLEM